MGTKITQEYSTGLPSKSVYLKTLKSRRGTSKAYKRHQLIGLEVAEILNDLRHKSLYIKLAKEKNPDEIYRLAKEVASRQDVVNPGAYFMRLLNPKKTKMSARHK